MAAARDARAAGERVEALLAELRTRAGPQAGDVAEELVGCLVELYGAGLAAIVATLGADPDAGPRLLAALAGDPLVESLLLVHDLHPLDADTRIERALERVRAAARRARGRDRVSRPRRSGRRRPAARRRAGTGAGPRPRRSGRPSRTRSRTRPPRWRACRSRRSRRRPRCRCCRSCGARQGHGDRDRGRPGCGASPPGRPPRPSGPAGSGCARRPRARALTRRRLRPGAAETGDAERCEMCREVLDGRHGHVVEIEQAVDRLHLPRLLPPVHLRGRGGRAVPVGARAGPPRPRHAAGRRGLERAADPGRDGVLLRQLGARPGGRGLSEPGGHDRVRTRPGGVGPAGRRLPAARRR